MCREFLPTAIHDLSLVAKCRLHNGKHGKFVLREKIHSALELAPAAGPSLSLF